MSPSDKMRGSHASSSAMQQFREGIEDANLIETPFTGDRFTWERGGLKERLDWVLSNFHWLHSFPSFEVRHELQFKSDHTIILESTSSGTAVKPHHRSFSYQAAWSLESYFKDIVQDSWASKDWKGVCPNFILRPLHGQKDQLVTSPRRKKPSFAE